jgi:hypothetical protein
LETTTRLHLRDVTLDQALLKYLILKVYPADAHEEARVEKAARYYTLDDMGLIWVLGSGSMWLRVPWLKDRGALVREIHQEAGLCSGEKLYQLMKSRYFWAGMRNTCLKEAEENVPR